MTRLTEMKIMKANMKAQANIMEYILMTLFIIIILVALIFFLYSWQVSQMQLDTARDYIERTVDLTDSLIHSLYFIKGSSMVVDPMLDDAKLTSLKETEGICGKFDKIFGPNWFVEVKVFEEENGEDGDVECTQENYPDCNLWTLCTKDLESTFVVMPVNIYRSVWERTDIGTIRVGIYD